MRHAIILFCLSFLFLTSCREDIEVLNVETTTQPPIITTGDGNIQVRGRVVDQDGNPLQDVLIAGFGETARSDENGNYTFPDTPTQPNGGASFYIAKDGYFEEFRQVYLREASINKLDIVMQSSLPDGSVNGETGGTYETEDGVKLIVPAGVARSGNQPYLGDIRIKIVYQDPTSYSDIEQSSANVPAWQNGEVVELATYGMAQVRMETEAGQRIFFTRDEPAILEMPLPVSLSRFTDTMRFWQLQEQIWFPQGLALVGDNTLSAAIFGSGLYNCDIPFPRATICGTLVDEDGMILADQSFALVINDGAFVFTTRTNEKGQFCVQVARDQILRIRIPDPCDPDETLFEITVGPFPEGPTQIGEIPIDFIPARKPVVVTDCEDGSPVTQDEGLIWISGFGGGYPVRTNDFGLANLLIPDCGGSGTSSFEVQAVANDQRRTSPIALVSSGDLSTLEMEICSEPEAEEFFQLSIANAGDFDMNEVSYLLRQRPLGPLSHQFWGRNITGTDTTEMFIYLLDLAPGDYPINPDIFRYEDGSRSYYSTCVNCPVESRLTISEVGPDQSFVKGSFMLQGSKRDVDTGVLIESDVIVSGSFHINR